ncbi:MAG: MmgE/PrpD family protein, partial [Nitrospira sp.]|nr:MmgE/PrpD family protein [Nitrospira sp.]
MAEFVERASYERLPESAIQQLKIRVLDSFGCAICALEAEPVRLIKRHIRNFGGNKLCTLIGGGKTSPDRAAFY